MDEEAPFKTWVKTIMRTMLSRKAIDDPDDVVIFLMRDLLKNRPVGHGDRSYEYVRVVHSVRYVVRLKQYFCTAPAEASVLSAYCPDTGDVDKKTYRVQSSNFNLEFTFENPPSSQ